MRKCRICEHYRESQDDCKYCNFEYWQDYPACDDTKWDILDLDDDVEWSHLQILDRLYYKQVECLFVDSWTDGNIAFLIGCKADENTISRVLGVHKECVYNDFEHGFMIINLFQEKYLRGIL